MFFAQAAILLLLTLTAQGETLTGHWSGTVTQSKPVESFAVEMTVNGSSGSIVYRSLGCGGSLEFLRGDGTNFWYREHITSGVDKCIDGGLIQVSMNGSSLSFNWSGSGVTVNGTISGTGRVEGASSAQWSGNWNGGEKTLVQSALSTFQDAGLKNWIASVPQLNRYKNDNFDPVTANGTALRFKDDFFSDAKTNPARRDNLIAFEGGKVFWNMMKDRPVAGGRTLEAWFKSYIDQHQTALSEMKAARHQNGQYSESLSYISDFIDPASQFGQVFRAQALNLEKPTQAQTEWNAVLREFQAHVQPLLQSQ